jgi:hypothetical protein
VGLGGARRGLLERALVRGDVDPPKKKRNFPPNPWSEECSGVARRQALKRSVAGRSQQQRQRVTIWSGCPAHAALVITYHCYS